MAYKIQQKNRIVAVMLRVDGLSSKMARLKTLPICHIVKHRIQTLLFTLLHLQHCGGWWCCCCCCRLWFCGNLHIFDSSLVCVRICGQWKSFHRTSLRRVLFFFCTPTLYFIFLLFLSSPSMDFVHWLHKNQQHIYHYLLHGKFCHCHGLCLTHRLWSKSQKCFFLLDMNNI